MSADIATDRFVTYKGLLPWLGGTIFALAAMGATLTVWVLGTARAEAQAIERHTHKTVEDLGKKVGALESKVDSTVGALRGDVQRESEATRGKLDDVMMLLITGRVRAPTVIEAPRPAKASTPITTPIVTAGPE